MDWCCSGGRPARAPVVIPLAWSATRPVLKAILKSGFILYERADKFLVRLLKGRGEGRQRQ